MRIYTALAISISLLLPLEAYAASSMLALWTDANANPSAVLDRDRSARAAWRKIVPVKYAKQSWVSDLLGNFNPVKVMSESGRIYVVGNDCKPYDCAMYSNYYVIEPGGSRAAGAVLVIQGSEPSYQYFGKADALQHEWLREMIVDHLHALGINQPVR